MAGPTPRWLRRTLPLAVLATALAVLPVVGTPGALAATNLLTNGDFEQSGSSPAGWVAINGTLTLASDGFGGGHAGKVAYSGSATYFVISSAPQPVSVTGGAAYTADGMVRSDIPGKLVCLQIVESGSQPGNAIGTCTTLTSSWGALPELTYTAKASGDTLAVRVLQRSAANGDSFESDNLSLSPPASSAAPIIAAVGDISCDPADPYFNAGNGLGKHCAEKATAALVAAGSSPGHPYDAVLPLGDLQYDCGSLSAYNASFDLAWGIFSAGAFPVPGNHEYETADQNGVPEAGCNTSATGYFQYFANKGNPNAPGVNGLGYYSRTIGTWHVIAINSNCAFLPTGGVKDGCAVGSPQETWLKNDLASNPSTCTLAYWHFAPWASKGKKQGIIAMRPIWADLANAGVDLVLVAHFHHYERFADMNASGVAVPNGTGTREIGVGTGGEGLGGFNAAPFPASQLQDAKTFGILSVTLGNGTYSWHFLPASPGTFTDSGTDTCH